MVEDDPGGFDAEPAGETGFVSHRSERWAIMTARHLRRGLVLLCAVGLGLGAYSAPAFAENVNFVGPLPAQGFVGHAAMSDPIPPPYDPAAGEWLGSHPLDGIVLEHIYPAVCSRDAFDYATGAELALGTSPPFAATASAPHALVSYGITGSLHLAGSGMTLDVSSEADYTYNPTTNVETRIYRNGTMAMFEETGPDSFRMVSKWQEVVTTMVIDWQGNTLESTSAGVVAPDSPLYLPGTFTNTSTDVVDEEGVTTEGVWGLFGVAGDFTVDMSYAVGLGPAGEADDEVIIDASGDPGDADNTGIRIRNLSDERITITVVEDAGSPVGDAPPGFVLLDRTLQIGSTAALGEVRMRVRVEYDPDELRRKSLQVGGLALLRKTGGRRAGGAFRLACRARVRRIEGPADFVLGHYGFDTTDQYVWAVVDVNSTYAVGAPEPGTLCLGLLALCGLMAGHRRRRAS